MGNRIKLFEQDQRLVSEVEFLPDEVIYLDYEDNEITINDELSYDLYGLQALIKGLQAAEKLLKEKELEVVGE